MAVLIPGPVFTAALPWFILVNVEPTGRGLFYASDRTQINNICGTQTPRSGRHSLYRRLDTAVPGRGV